MGTEAVADKTDPHPPHSDTDISSQAFWDATAEEREKTFAQLRDKEPISWQRPIENAFVPNDNELGYWAVVKHKDIMEVSRNPDLYVSGRGVLFDDLPTDFLQLTQSFLAMDPPDHSKLRGLVSKAFTPKQIRQIEDQVTVAAAEVVDGFSREESGKIEFVARCAKQLPLRMFSLMFGVPEHLRDQTAAAAQKIISWADPEHLGDRDPATVQLEACQELHSIAGEITDLRRKDPKDDLFTNLVQAEVDGEHLTNHQIGSFFVLLSVAANDTTMNATTWTLKEFTDHPDQRDWLMEDFDGRIDSAVEEIIRHTSPVMTFRRTAVEDAELGGRQVFAGDKVVMFYSSGNRDVEVFDAPDRFDLSRKPNQHVGFGGGGRHMCLGNQLAKSMLRAIWRELLTRVPDIRAASEPKLLGTNFIRGVKAMDAEFTPES
ncbi:MAG TPA: cytochrome P450 [Pseudonocardia sp.]|jgi:cytochrome P450|nr:cytochrome P450 [Pseudonocardia sp.]